LHITYTFTQSNGVALITEVLLVMSRLHTCTSTGETPRKLVWRTFKFLTTVIMKLTIFWDVMQCALLYTC